MHTNIPTTLPLLRLVQPAVIKEVSDHLESTGCILVKVKVMATTRMQVRREPRILVVRPCRLVEDTRAIAITDDVIGSTSDSLIID
jgi:RNA-binding protein YhbY